MPRALEIAADALWTDAWVASSNAFFYRRTQGTAEGAADLNLLIAPIYSWLYFTTGDARFQERGDQLFARGVTGAYLGGGKQFSQ